MHRSTLVAGSCRHGAGASSISHSSISSARICCTPNLLPHVQELFDECDALIEEVGRPSDRGDPLEPIFTEGTGDLPVARLVRAWWSQGSRATRYSGAACVHSRPKGPCGLLLACVATGRAGLDNPRFSEGEEQRFLDLLRAALTAGSVTPRRTAWRWLSGSMPVRYPRSSLTRFGTMRRRRTWRAHSCRTS